MTDFPGYCASCRGIFTTNQVFSFKNACDVKIQSSSTNCPRCGSMSRLIDGHFDFIDNRIIVRDAPLYSILVIAGLTAARQIRDGRLREDELFAPLQHVPEQIQNIARIEYKNNGISGYFKAIITAISVLIAASSIHVDGHVDLNILVDQIRTGLTGAAPYPGLIAASPEASAPASPDATVPNAPDVAGPHEGRIQQQAQSRQQRRQQERQARKPRRPGGKSTSPKKSR